MLFKIILSIISKRPILPINGTLTGTTMLDQRGPGNNGSKGVLHIP